MSIPFHLVTGFLGSGKTSFLKSFLKQYAGKGRIAIIQNEFSPVGIDGKEFSESGDYQVLEINNGSAFCVCLLGSFISSLSTFIDEVKPDMLLMETSGLSDTIAVGQIFQSGVLKGKVYLAHTWCLVDAKNFGWMPALEKRTGRQIQSADTIIINKTDLAVDQVEDVIGKVRKVNPFASVLKGTYGNVELKDQKRAFNMFPSSEGVPLNRPDLESFVVRSSLEISNDSLHLFIDNILSRIIRMKGFIKTKGKKAVFVQGVFSDCTISEIPWFEGSGQLVLIGTFGGKENYQVTYEAYCKYEN